MNIVFSIFFKSRFLYCTQWNTTEATATKNTFIDKKYFEENLFAKFNVKMKMKLECDKVKSGGHTVTAGETSIHPFPVLAPPCAQGHGGLLEPFPAVIGRRQVDTNYSHSHTHSYRQFRVPNSPHMHVFGLWEHAKSTQEGPRPLESNPRPSVLTTAPLKTLTTEIIRAD